MNTYYIVTLGLCNITAKLPSEGLCSWPPRGQLCAGRNSSFNGWAPEPPLQGVGNTQTPVSSANTVATTANGDQDYIFNALTQENRENSKGTIVAPQVHSESATIYDGCFFVFFRLLMTSMKPSSFISISLSSLIASGCAVAELLS